MIDGLTPLTVTQCTVAEITGAGAGPVVEISSLAPITIIGLDTVGGTVGWFIGTDGHELKAVWAREASQVGLWVAGDDNTISVNAVRDNAVGIRIEGARNDFRGGTVEDNDGDGVVLAATATGTIVRDTNVQANGGHGIVVEGSGNTIRDNSWVHRNVLNGILVTGANNTLRSNWAEENGEDGFTIQGQSNTLQDNKANKNGSDGFDIRGTGTRLKGNASNQGASGGSNENRGAEFNISAAAINHGGNKADPIGVPKTTAPVKCPTFPAAGICE